MRNFKAKRVKIVEISQEDSFIHYSGSIIGLTGDFQEEHGNHPRGFKCGWFKGDNGRALYFYGVAVEPLAAAAPEKDAQGEG